MKKTLLFFAAVFALGAASAQVSVIPKAGLTLARQHFDETRNSFFNKKNIKHSAGFTTGVAFNVPVGENNQFFFQPELLYMQKGYRLKFINEYRAITESDPILGQDPSVQIDSKDVINYLEVPVLGQVMFGTEQFKFFLTAGPSVAFALNGRYTWHASTDDFTEHSEGRILFKKEPENANGNDQYLDPAFNNRVDIGIQTGAGCGLAAGPGMLQIEARYGYGLTPFFTGNPNDQANRVFAFTLGYAIPLGSK